MSLLSAAFNNKVCTVNRYGAGTPGADGHWTLPSVASTFQISASVQPVSGRALRDLREGLRAEDVRVIYTEIELRTVTVDQGNELYDELQFDGSTWRVIKVETFTVLSGHYRATVERVSTP